MLNKQFLRYDIAFLLTALPQFVHIRLSVLAFVIVCLILIFLKVQIKNIILFVIGSIGFLSAWFAYDYELSQKVILLHNVLTFMGMFFLVLGITLRLGKKKNFVLYLSPFFMMVFSLHYFDKDIMMFYSLFCIYLFLTLYIWERQKLSIKEAIKYSNKMLLASIPLFVILFVFYPRAEDTTTQRMDNLHESDALSGFEGSISLKNAGSVTPSKDKAFEVLFDDAIPNEQTLYFRGSVLYADKYGRWKPRVGKEYRKSPKLNMNAKQYEYTIYLYPHNKKWLYSLDYLSKTLKGTHLYVDRTLMAEKNIEKAFRYKLWSSFETVREELSTQERKSALLIGKNIAPKLYKSVEKIKTIKDPLARIQILQEFMKSQKLSYTLDPVPITEKSEVDDFFFYTKEGYCTHFSIAFATAAQYVGIPSRIVTGYLSYPEQRIGKYLSIEQRNAHAWSEIYLPNKGWVRIETTSFAKGEVNLNGLRSEGWKYYWDRFILYFEYILHTIQEKLLEIEEYFKLDFLKDLFQKVGILIPILIGVLVLLIGGYFISFVTSKKRTHEYELQKLLLFLKQHGYIKAKGETLEAFLKRVASKLPKDNQNNLLEISRYYHQWVYGEMVESKERFLKSKKEFMELLD